MLAATAFVGSLVALSLSLTTSEAAAQTVLQACYIPNTGVVYRIGLPDTRDECRSPRHVEFSWTDAGGADHGALTGLADDDHAQYLLADGSRALSGSLAAGGNKVTGLGAATAAGDAVRYEQAVLDGDAAGGDLGGSYPDPTVGNLQGNAVSTAAPSDGQVLTWDGTASEWTPTSANGASPWDGLVFVEDYIELTVPVGEHIMWSSVARCPANHIVINGGYRVFSGGPSYPRPGDVKVTASHPRGSDGRGWALTAIVHNSAGRDLSFRWVSFAICVPGSPSSP
jgi:hypothetical protein